ncbi:alpha-glycosidase [Anaerolentibacter hominis]|uniref:alpha-glycosidase n=1 Tax=Anaerolentibacter hominis TaxID=3079009 RepID=UPI0031B83FCD
MSKDAGKKDSMISTVKWDRLGLWDKIRMYTESVMPLFREKSLFSDGTKQFRNPPEPDPYEDVTIRLRALAGTADLATLVSGDKEYSMSVAQENELFEYFECTIPLQDRKISYYFRVVAGGAVYYYNQLGTDTVRNEEYDFEIIPGFHVPRWAKGAVYYQIFVDRFYNGDTSNDVETGEYIYINQQTSRITEWSKYPAAMDVGHFYGGDLAGVMKKMDYLEQLGVEVIYLNPIFVSPSNHKYDIQDYDYVDPHYGVIVKDGEGLLKEGETDNTHALKYIRRVTDRENLEAGNELFATLVEEAHNRGMRVILDGVFNHCGSFNKWLDREKIYKGQDGYETGAYLSESSPYRKYFRFMDDKKWPDNGSYIGWWNHDTLPKLNYEESEELYNYVMQIARKWVSPPFNADGWRLDVAADLGFSLEFNHTFWKDFRKNVKEANPNAIILAEHYGDATAWLQGDQWDTVMNYDGFMEPVSWFLTGMEKHSDSRRADLEGDGELFFRSMRRYLSSTQPQSYQTAMNELSNHDHSRFLTRTNGQVGRVASAGSEAAEEGTDKALMRLAVMIQMTWTGAPTVYYGDEAGLCGWTDPDNRRTYPWGGEDQELIDYHRELIHLHKSYNALKEGSLIALDAQENYISYGRFDSNDQFIVAINKGDSELTVTIPIWIAGVLDKDRLVSLIATDRDGYSLEAEMYDSYQGKVEVTLPPCGGIVLKNTRAI